jgi:tetratricopeptide (TPR) repeat protein
MKKIITTIILILSMFTTLLYAEQTIGVTKFKNLNKKKSYKWLEIGVPESISFKLRSVKEYIVLERINVDKVMNEIALGQSGLTDVNKAKQAGKALNADLLVVGNFQIYGMKVRITAKIIDVESHKVLKQVQETGSLEDIFSLQDKIALAIVEESDIGITDELREQITKKSTNNLSAYEFYSKGQKFYLNGHYKRSIKMFEKAVKRDRNYALAYSGLGKAYAAYYWKIHIYTSVKKPKLLEKSYKYSKKALELDSNLDEAHVSLSKYYQNVDKSKVKDKWKKCEGAAKKAIKINPNNGEAYLMLSRVYGYDDKKEEKYIHKALSRNKFLINGYNNLGIIYLAKKKYPKAEEYFREAMRLNPELPEAYTNIGVVYSRQKRYKEAIKYYEIIVGKYPKYARGLTNIAIGYRNLKDLDLALKYAKKAVKVNRKFVPGYSEIGYIYLTKKKYKKAVKYYKKGLKLDKKAKFILANMGYCLVKLKKYKKAEKYLKDALKYHKKYAWPAAHMAWYNKVKLQNFEESLKWYKEAYQRDPKKSYWKEITDLETKISQ